VKVHGVARKIDRTLLKEIDAVVSEALFNVCRHAKANKADVTVHFEPNQVTISISDDGIGIDERILDAGQRAGHFGLPGMRERARQANGRLTIQAMPRQGTLVRLSLPTDGSRPRHLPRLLRRLLRQQRLADVD
jgi:signal transduction histidine kinase